MHLIQRFHYANADQYQIWLEILKSPEPVTGYRHIRHPKQDAARQTVETAMARLSSGVVMPRAALRK